MGEDVLARALTLGLIAVLVPLFLRSMSGGVAAPGSVRYSRGARVIVTVCSTFILIVVAFAAARSHLGNAHGAWLLIAFAALGLSLALEFLRVHHSYNEKGIEYRSPWSRNRVVAWSEVREIRWRSAMKWLDIVPADRSSRIHFSPLLAGLNGLAHAALDNIPASALDSDTEAPAALRIMASGHAGTLITDARKPSAIAAQLFSGAT